MAPLSPPPSIVALSRGAKALILSAERLFAKHGVDEVSLRQIVAEAGQSNSYAIQHHFGDKDGLIRAILELRLPQLNALREARLRKLNASGRRDVHALVDALLMPIADFTDESGRHVYAQFLLRQGWDKSVDVWSRESGHAPAAFEILDALQTRLPGLGAKTFSERLQLITILFLNAVIRLDGAAFKAKPLRARKKYLAQAIDMCAAALQTPPR